MLDEIERNFMLFQECVQAEVILVGWRLTGYASFYSVGCETYRLKLGVETLFSLVMSPWK
jgi:hypothetical protein